MAINFDRLQAPSPRESMHSELIMERNRNELRSLAEVNSIEIAAWLKIKNTEDLPVMLLVEYQDSKSQRWAMVDTARVRNVKGTILLTGVVNVTGRQLQDLQLYVCHPNPGIDIQVEELRFNGSLVRKDYIDAINIA